MSGFQRGLDLAPTATIDKVALNNKVVLMRAVVRRSKLHLINGLVKKVHKLRDKKGSEAQKKQNKNKADKMLEDIKIIKVLKPDYVSKYALGTTVKFEELAAKASTTSEMRALARLAAHKFIMLEVNKFRKEHEDWKDLAAYLMTKHTSREFKKKKTKEKMKKVEANMIASENLVQKYLGEKLEGRTDLEDEDDNVKPGGEVIDDDSDADDDINDGDESDGGDKEAEESSNESSEEVDERTSENANNQRKISENKKSIKKKDVNLSKKDDIPSKVTKTNKNNVKESVILDKESEDSEVDNGDDDDADAAAAAAAAAADDDDDDDDDETDNDSVNNDKDFENEDEDNDGDDDDGGGGGGDDDDDDETKEKVKNKTQIPKKLKDKKGTKEKNTKKTKTNSKVPIGAKVTNITPKKNVSKEKVEGEMIVKKLNLAKDFADDDIPKILLSDNEDKIVKHKKKRKDLFFDTGEEYDSRNHDGDQNEVSNSGDFGNDFGGGENEVLENDNRENYERSIQPTMTAFTTCFVGSLKSSDMMGCNDSQYRSNEDWKRIRHEMKEQKFGSFRGRGQGPVFRGRGSSNSFISHNRGRGFSDGPRGRGFPGGPRGRGHTGRGQGFDGFRGRGRGGFESNDRTRGGPATKQPASKKSGGGLHPSWEASKKRKQEQKAVLQAFEGKKIKFDD